MWICAAPDPLTEIFGVRTHVEPCDVTVLFLTPIPQGLSAAEMGAYRQLNPWNLPVQRKTTGDLIEELLAISGIPVPAVVGPGEDQRRRELWEQTVVLALQTGAPVPPDFDTWDQSQPKLADDFEVQPPGLAASGACCFDETEPPPWGSTPPPPGHSGWDEAVNAVRREKDDAVYGSLAVIGPDDGDDDHPVTVS